MAAGSAPRSSPLAPNRPASPSKGKGRWELAMKADLEKILVPEPQHRYLSYSAVFCVTILVS
jgi:hypothetical protein